MSELTLQKRKTVVLASAIACFQMPGLLITQHLRNSSDLPAFVICWCVLMAALFAYVMVQFSILMKMKRGVR